MIARISSGTYIKGAVMYNENKVEEGEANLIGARNFESDDIDISNAIFRMDQQCRKSDTGKRVRVKKPVFSCSLNLNDVDLAKLEELKKVEGEASENDLYCRIADRYMEGMGYGKQPYIIYKHNDIERTHIHIVSIRVDENRRKINDSYEHKRSERVRQEINKEFGLSTKGENEKIINAEKRSNYIHHARESILLLREDKKVKQKISNVLKFVLENYHPKNFQEYNKILSQFSIGCKKIETQNKRGELIVGCSYGVIDDKGDFVSPLIAGSKISEKFSYNKLLSLFSINSGEKKGLRELDAVSKKFIEKQIESVMVSPRELDMEYIKSTLEVRGIGINLVRGEGDKIVGINYIDNVNGKVHSGSSIGRKYTYGNILSRIKSHNRQHEAGMLDKEIYIKANKLLVSLYNSDRKKDYYFESDFIKNLGEKRSKYSGYLCKELLLTDKQAEKCFNSYMKFKTAQLTDIEHKENSYVKKQMMTSVLFASKMVDDAKLKIGFLNGMGVGVTIRDNKTIYYSLKKEDIWLDNKETGVGEILDKKDINKSEDVILINKSDRELIKSILEDNYTKKVGMSSIRLIELLDGKEQRYEVAQKCVTNCEEVKKVFERVVTKVRNIAMRERGELESNYIMNIDRYKDDFIRISRDDFGIGESVSEVLYDEYKQQSINNINEIHIKENKSIENRIRYSLKFAEQIKDPVRKTEFMKKMEITVSKYNGNTYFSYDRKPEYTIMESKLSGIRQNFGGAINKNIKKFNKQERDYVRNYVEGKPLDENFGTAMSYIDSNREKEERKRVIVNKAMRILDSTHISKPQDIVETLIYRGILVFPKDNGYVVGRISDKDNGTLGELPDEVTKILNRSNYKKIYKDYIDSYYNRGKNPSKRINMISKVAMAQDYNNAKYLEEAKEMAMKIDVELADAIHKLTQDKAIDYRRIIKMIDNYDSKGYVILPPATQVTGRSLLEEEKDILLKNLRQFGSQYALDLLQYGRDYMIENDEEYQKKYNNKIK